ncbi:hypothetical protein KQ247_11895 [Ruegeria pomeroyi]|uniref:Uncharacterized protein n=3 Tax=Ruegeria pomeroyi TaxID=89184 RepID=Q5LVQ6_RUEPO|nr:hypothetical protein [Ruegeria pomeroyi]AAV93952.2 hypothetical protein SPO0644 [Ruegeria pomeroyi DSS-3]NVK98415.1 hypothetical protein [Ruegeria pomeroyi]NVL02852.1 hypothetical protein [Ruegeria pomeroyi]QWV07540.1 hypothetical protein KQ247_11895 [Ruegeria pomeroyi]
MSTSNIHPMASEHLPRYIVAADGSDYLFTVMAVFTVGLILLIGVGYFTLHALPERMAHKNNHSQFQLVGILALLALFTHNNVFWVAAVLVAGFQIPDLAAPLRAISDAIRGLGKTEDQGNATPSERAPEPTPHPAAATEGH